MFCLFLLLHDVILTAEWSGMCARLLDTVQTLSVVWADSDLLQLPLKLYVKGKDVIF
jgi:hypothetical protein